MGKITVTALAIVSGWMTSGRAENSAIYRVNARGHSLIPNQWVQRLVLLHKRRVWHLL